MKKVGTHLVIDAWEAPADLLNNPERILDAMIKAIAAGEATLIDICVHQFSPQGVTATATLAESHIAIHTWPEYGYFAADLFFCGQGKPTEAMKLLQTVLQAKQIKIIEIERSLPTTRSEVKSSMTNNQENIAQIVDFGNGERKWAVEDVNENLKLAVEIKDLLCEQKSQFQNIQLIDTFLWGKALYLDGQMQSGTEKDQFIYHESLCHPTLIHHPNPKRVFIMGGGAGSTAREVLKHKNIEYVCMADIDEAVINLCRQYFEDNKSSFADPRLDIVIGDAAEILASSGRFDVIIADLPDPVEASHCYQFFTKEFYHNLVQNHLNPKGIFVTQSGFAGVLSHKKVFTTIHHTLTRVFPKVIPYTQHIPSFADCWGFQIGLTSTEAILDATEFDQRLQNRVQGELKFLDGETWTSLTILNKILRKSLAQETKIYSK